MTYLRAASRLNNVNASLELATQEMDAQLDTAKGDELQRIQRELRRAQIIFSFARPHLLYHKSNPTDIVREAEHCATCLDKLGFTLTVVPGVYGKPSFALRGKDGIVLQKVQNGLRIFFSV